MEYESNGDRNKNFSIEEYLYKYKPYSKGILIDLQKSGKWIAIAINFLLINDVIRLKIAISSKDTDEKRKIHSKMIIW